MASELCSKCARPSLSNYERVQIFNQAFGIPTNDTVSDNIFAEDAELLNMRLDLIKSEMAKLEANVADCNMLGCIERLSLLLYAAYGCAATLGLDLDKSFTILHDSNMSKLCKSETAARQTVEHYSKSLVHKGKVMYKKSYGNYYQVYNESQGKVLKSLTFKEPDYSSLYNIGSRIQNRKSTVVAAAIAFERGEDAEFVANLPDKKVVSQTEFGLPAPPPPIAGRAPAMPTSDPGDRPDRVARMEQGPPSLNAPGGGVDERAQRMAELNQLMEKAEETTIAIANEKKVDKVKLERERRMKEMQEEIERARAEAEANAADDFVDPLASPGRDLVQRVSEVNQENGIAKVPASRNRGYSVHTSKAVKFAPEVTSPRSPRRRRSSGGNRGSVTYQRALVFEQDSDSAQRASSAQRARPSLSTVEEQQAAVAAARQYEAEQRRREAEILARRQQEHAARRTGTAKRHGITHMHAQPPTANGKGATRNRAHFDAYAQSRNPPPPAVTEKLAPGFFEGQDPKSGLVYWANPTTRETSWVKPVVSNMAPGWRMAVTTEGQAYYFRGRERSWKFPFKQ